jgi:hypothetical protein
MNDHFGALVGFGDKKIIPRCDGQKVRNWASFVAVCPSASAFKMLSNNMLRLARVIMAALTNPNPKTNPMKKSTIITKLSRPFAGSTLTAALVITTVASMALTAQGAIVVTNTTYANYGDFSVSSTDLVNFGQSTLDSYSHTGSDDNNDSPDQDRGFINGAASNGFGDMTWFRNANLPATLTLNLDVSVNTLGYAITQIDSYAGFQAGAEQGDQIMTVEYSLVGNPGFTTLNTYTYTAPGVDEFGLISLTDDSGYVLYGVDALRFTYAENAIDNMVLQEIDVLGVAVPEPSSTALLGLGGLALALRRRRS